MKLADIGLVGLGVMGSALARNLRSRGLAVAVANHSRAGLDRFMAAWGDPGFLPCPDHAAMAASLAQPRRILLMVTAGEAVDQVLDGLLPHLDPGDVVVDCGNSHWPDTERRLARLKAEGIHFVGMGVSGGEEGALLGPALMPGGDHEAWPLLQPVLEPIAAVSDRGPCVSWCGSGGAGHFVKMVHNGIEYGDMQLIAETWTLLRQGLGLSAAATRALFERWNEGPLESYLVEITAGIVGALDPGSEGLLVDHILDVAGQKGTGRWTVLEAVEAGVPLSTISAAVDARALSARWEDRQRAAEAFPASPQPLAVDVGQIEQALYAAKLMSYTQGFDLLRQASVARGYGTDLAEVGRIWKAGCIIRARFLDRVHDAFRAEPDLPLLCLDPGLAADLRAALPAWRAVVSASSSAGYPIPAMSASLAWFESMRQARGSAALIQAQRDLFGAHTYRRIEDPDSPVHTDWAALDQAKD